jgi:hypothetical protein
VEIGLLQDRLVLEVGAYHKWSTDVLMNVSVPASTGFTSYWDNVGTVMNRGVELSIKSYNTTGRLGWVTELNVSKNYNELIDIGEYTPDAISGGSNDSRVIVGRPIGSFFLVEHSHIDTETGLPVYIDLEGNETFAVGDFLRIKDQSNDEWLEVANADSAPTYVVARDKNGDYAVNTNPVWTKGASVVNFGASGDGAIQLTASEEGAPFISFITILVTSLNPFTIFFGILVFIVTAYKSFPYFFKELFVTNFEKGFCFTKSVY